MPATLPLEPAWNTRRWVVAIGVLLAAQVLVVLVLSRSGPAAIRSEPAGSTVVRLATETEMVRSIAGDPALFALMSRDGFSGKAWLDLVFFKHSLNDWQAPPSWLSATSAGFGNEFRRYAASNGINRMLVDDKPAPQPLPLPAFFQLKSPSPAVIVGSELAGRPLVTPMELPDWSHTDVLDNSVVEVVVNATGDVVSARLLSGSGLKAADDRALELAQQARFAVRPGEQRARANPWLDLATGTLTFRWRTLAGPPVASAAKKRP